ncbi:MAG: hypothetical protein QMB43_02330, partial [Alistipes putredinis]
YEKPKKNGNLLPVFRGIPQSSTMTAQGRAIENLSSVSRPASVFRSKKLPVGNFRFTPFPSIFTA